MLINFGEKKLTIKIYITTLYIFFKCEFTLTLFFELEYYGLGLSDYERGRLLGVGQCEIDQLVVLLEVCVGVGRVVPRDMHHRQLPNTLHKVAPQHGVSFSTGHF